MCWAFDTVPSQLLVLYWSMTYGDIKYKLRVRIGETQATHSQTFEALCNTVALALGGDKGEGGESAPQDDQTPKNKAEAMARFRSVFG